MKINGHAHIFTLSSVLSHEAIRIIASRLRSMGFREFVIDAVVDVLEQQLLRPEFLTEEELLQRFVAAMLRSPQLSAITPHLPFAAILTAGNLTGLGVRALQSILDRLSSWIESRDGPGKSPYDVYQTLRIAMQPSIPAIAGSLLKHLGPDDAIVALMMDIVADNEPDRDKRNFLSQIDGTQQAALRYPGRVFPFIAVNPKRADHEPIMRNAIEQRGFVGVKLYPSLGFELSAVRSVLEYCAREDVPITVHTTASGFFKDPASAQLSHPRHWQSLLQDMPTLRVCFAHCGGWGGFCRQEHDQIAWADQILAYMDAFENVYADLSYHVEMMIKGGAAERAYLDALRDLLRGPRRERIIFGTDSWLLRLNIDDALYWRYFETHLTRAELETVTGVAPARFLGLPVAGMPMKPNIARFVRSLEQQADRVGAPPAAWLRGVSTVTWRVAPLAPAWSRTNVAHVLTYNHFRGQIPKRSLGRGFDDCGSVRLAQLAYFTFLGSPPPALIVAATTRNLVARCKSHGAEPAPAFAQSLIDERITEVLREGRSTLADLGAALESMYRFPA